MAETVLPPTLAPKRIGLALGGGAALGWAHIGALRALEEAGIVPDVVAGTSMGAIVGAAWLCGALDALEGIARSMSWQRLVAFADPKLGAPGLLRGDAIVRELVRHFGSRRIEDLPRPFVAVAADLISGTEVEIREGPLELAVRASFSVPGVFLPVGRKGQLLVDGGLVNPIPVTAAHSLGADFVIAVDVMGDYHGRARAAGLVAPPEPLAEVASAQGDWLKSFSGRLFSRSSKRPGLYSIATVSGALIMRTLAEAKLRLAPADLRVVPSIGHISPIEFDRAEELISAGHAAMAEHTADLAHALASHERISSR
jgi:NTE family protein